jgi:hypothetical protein
MNITIEGKLTGVYQEDRFFFARVVPDFKEFDVIDIPINHDLFARLKLDKRVKITVEITD